MLAASTGGGQEDQRARGFTRPIVRASFARARARVPAGFGGLFILCALRWPRSARNLRTLRAIQTGGGQEDLTRSR